MSFPGQVAEESRPDVRAQVGGWLAIAAGALVLLDTLFIVVDYGFSAGPTLLLVVGFGLAIAGGVLAVTGRIQVAPWLIIAGLVVGLLPSVVYGRWWPWEALQSFPAVMDFEGPLRALLWVLAGLAPLMLIGAGVLTVLALVQARPAQVVTSSTALTGTGAAVVQADGSVAPGWYRDPQGLPSDRYWDGASWTDQTRPLTVAPAGMPGVRPTVDAYGNPVSPSSRLAAALLCWFLGVIGVHRFYVGKVGTGVAMIFTLGGLGIWALVDFIMILAGSFRDKQGRPVANW